MFGELSKFPEHFTPLSPEVLGFAIFFTIFNKKNMERAKNLGIWMDHANAHLMEFTTEPTQSKWIASDFTHQVKENSLNNRGEKHSHIKEQHLQAEYYKKLGAEIMHYEEVLLFGPTDAKLELFNILNADNRFAKIKIDVQSAEKMTENQEHAFVNQYFSK
jgi:hypothetical protein